MSRSDARCAKRRCRDDVPQPCLVATKQSCSAATKARRIVATSRRVGVFRPKIGMLGRTGGKKSERYGEPAESFGGAASRARGVSLRRRTPVRSAASGDVVRACRAGQGVDHGARQIADFTSVDAVGNRPSGCSRRGSISEKRIVQMRASFVSANACTGFPNAFADVFGRFRSVRSQFGAQ